MIRKMLVVATAIAMPVSMVAIVGGATVAGAAKGPPPQAMTCSITGTVNYAPPGLSYRGAVSTAKTSSVTTSSTLAGAGCAGGLNASIVSKGTKCPKVAVTPGCVKPLYQYDTAGAFAATGTAAIVKSLKKGISTTDHGTAVLLKVAGANLVTAGGVCGGNVGFTINGAVKKATNTFTLTLCLSGDTAGPGGVVTGNTGNDLGLAAGGITSIVVASSTIDPVLSSLVISA